MMKWQRTVTYEVTAPSLGRALEAWDDDGPNVGGRVQAVASSAFEAIDGDEGTEGSYTRIVGTPS